MRLWNFRGGLNLDGHKQESVGKPIETARIPPELVIPLQQHNGAAAAPLVQPGDRVLTGQPLTASDDLRSPPIHAGSSGIITALEPRPTPHPSGLPESCLVIATDGRDEWTEPMSAMQDYRQVSPVELHRRIHQAGIVGLGGAAFPTAAKLTGEEQSPVELLVLNAAECEPYISCDDRLLRERADQVVEGLRILRHALQARRCIIGIEDSMPEAHAALSIALARAGISNIDLVKVPSRYPVGGEKQLIHILTGKEVPAGGLPRDMGIVCHNVGTAQAVYQAVVHGRPLISRIVTVTGSGVLQPGNLEVRIGTPVHSLIEHCGGYADNANRLIMGGSMMGFALADDAVPATKATNCILVGDPERFPEPAPAMPCIRCGACVDACPVGLLPQQLYWHTRAKDHEQLKDHNLFDCIECGCCEPVCPSQIPLVQYYRFAKSEIRAQDLERHRAEQARQRYELRLQRLEREKREQEERRRQKKEALKQARSGDAKKDAIAAALARAKQKKTADRN